MPDQENTSNKDGDATANYLFALRSLEAARLQMEAANQQTAAVWGDVAESLLRAVGAWEGNQKVTPPTSSGSTNVRTHGDTQYPESHYDLHIDFHDGGRIISYQNQTLEDVANILKMDAHSTRKLTYTIQKHQGK